MAVSLDECGGHVINGILSETGLRQIRTAHTNQALLEDGYFVFNTASTAVPVATAGRRLISTIGFRTDTVTVRY
jgi:hypothetical protein